MAKLCLNCENIELEDDSLFCDKCGSSSEQLFNVQLVRCPECSAFVLYRPSCAICKAQLPSLISDLEVMAGSVAPHQALLELCHAFPETVLASGKLLKLLIESNIPEMPERNLFLMFFSLGLVAKLPLTVLEPDCCKSLGQELCQYYGMVPNLADYTVISWALAKDVACREVMRLVGEPDSLRHVFSAQDLRDKELSEQRSSLDRINRAKLAENAARAAQIRAQESELEALKEAKEACELKEQALNSLAEARQRLKAEVKTNETRQQELEELRQRIKQDVREGQATQQELQKAREQIELLSQSLAQANEELVAFRLRLTKLTPVAGPSDSSSSTRAVGLRFRKDEEGLISFGHYHICGTYKTEAIRWQVLKECEHKMLLLAQWGLDSQPFHRANEGVSWEGCSLRSWLNQSFFATAFSPQEQEHILSTKVSNLQRVFFVNVSDKPTQDYLFLLSVEEVKSFWTQPEQLLVKPTPYAVTQGAEENLALLKERPLAVRSLSEDDSVSSTGWWWLRNGGVSSSFAGFVSSRGLIFDNKAVNASGGLVRPAMWITTTKEK